MDAFFTLLPHDVSIALAVFGSIPTPRFAHAELVDDRAVSICAVLSGPHYLVIEAGNRYADKRREVRLHCRDGVAVLPHGEADWIEVATDDPDDPEHPRIERRSLPSDPPLRRELEVFVKHLGGGPPPKTTAAEGALVVETVAALRRMAGVES